MSTVFIDVLKESKKKNANKAQKNTAFNETIISKIIYRLFSFNIKKDILKENKSNINYYFIINESLSNKLENREKYKLSKKIFTICTRIFFRKQGEIKIVFSKNFKIYKGLKNTILETISKSKNARVVNIEATNNILANDIKYIDNYIKKKKIQYNKFKLLIVINDIVDYPAQKLVEYISKYKFVDILKTGNISKREYRQMQENISKINDEYGTTIDIIQKRNIQSYNCVLSYSDLSKEQLVSKYILKKDAEYINVQDPDYDVLGNECRTYEKNKLEIETLFNRMGIDINNFSKNKLGKVYNVH